MNFLSTSLLFVGMLLPTPDQDRRINKLEDSLMAPCCYSQNIREHMSMEAAQMRDEVSKMVLSGKSDQEILAFYVGKYGETILVVPDGIAGMLAFGVPIGVALMTAGIAAFYVSRSVRRRSVATHPALSASRVPIPAEMLKRIRSELQDDI
jgi:cytochrome c-type biogenesis protein CcmH